jgi:polyisoprenoid-binding protein YceI
MKMKYFFAIPLLFSAGFGFQVQAQSQSKLDASRSKIEFISTKNEGVKVPGVFKTIQGTFSFTKAGLLQGTVTVDIDSLSTDNPARDANLKTLFFETDKKPAFKTATFVLGGKLLKKNISTDGKPVELRGSLAMHGKKVPLSVPVTVTKQADSIEIKNSAPVVMDFAKWNFMGNVPTLMKACGHKKLEPKADLNIDLFFPNAS